MNKLNSDLTKSMSVKKSRFTEMLIEENALDQSGFESWIFCHGSCSIPRLSGGVIMAGGILPMKVSIYASTETGPEGYAVLMKKPEFR
jgi:hypothetical protein